MQITLYFLFKIMKKWKYTLIDINANQLDRYWYTEHAQLNKKSFREKSLLLFCPNVVMLLIGFAEQVWFKYNPQ